jgi:hypothetical protein
MSRHLELLFGDEPQTYRATRGVKVPRKWHDPDSLMSWAWEPHPDVAARYGGVEQARDFRDSLLAVPVRDPLDWTDEERDVMEGIEARNSALAERQEIVLRMPTAKRQKHTHGKGETDGSFEYDPVRPLRTDSNLDWHDSHDDPLAA